ncbi:serine/arginine repetitive matrix protein 2-like isoform X2 [Trichogramma pretiosum]|uniref:serine/arginine repetitive matrix protein 2-like isoform X2 n=1 Tax=Trichogramma pretiosum TaxID=7493 RepID=UPI0006C9C373|nr:serine/arginine repetitive matrix protein 2-like isoform X2 [Trichogramma pretiosum]
MSNDHPKAQESREHLRLRWMWEQNQRREHERRKREFMAEYERNRAERLRQGGENNGSDDNRESRDEPSRCHHREPSKSPMVKEKQLKFTVEARESDPSRPTVNYQNVVIERRPGSIAGEGSRPIFDRPEVRVNGESWSNFTTHRRTSSERASSSYAPAEEYRTISVVDPAESSAVSAPRRTDHRREPAIFEPASSSSSSSICRRFQDISLGNHHRVRARSRDDSRVPTSERDDHRRVQRRSRSSSASRRPESRSIHHSRSPSRSRTSQHHHRASDRRRRSRSPERSHRRRCSSRSRSRSPSSRRGLSVYGPQMPYPFLLPPPPPIFPMGPFPYLRPPPPPTPPLAAPPRHPAPRFNAGNPYYRAPYR